MLAKATAEAAANIAFVKYWGSRSPGAARPYHASISMTLSECTSRSTVEVLDRGNGDEVWRLEDGTCVPADADFAQGVFRHLDAIRLAAGFDCGFRVATRNRFPTGAGLASSASGFAALAVAANAALGLGLGTTELSRLAAASGSGSAARSVLGGYVEWPVPGDDPAAGAAPLAGADHWTLCDLIAVVDAEPKEVSSREGHRRAASSPHFAARLAQLPDRLEATRRAIGDRDLGRLGPLLEEEAIELHLVAMTSRPPIFYWRPGTLEVLDAVHALQREGVCAYATMDAGPNVHVVCPPDAMEPVRLRLAGLAAVAEVIVDRTGAGPRLLAEHLL